MVCDQFFDSVNSNRHKYQWNNCTQDYMHGRRCISLLVDGWAIKCQISTTKIDECDQPSRATKKAIGCRPTGGSWRLVCHYISMHVLHLEKIVSRHTRCAKSMYNCTINSKCDRPLIHAVAVFLPSYTIGIDDRMIDRDVTCIGWWWQRSFVACQQCANFWTLFFVVGSCSRTMSTCCFRLRPDVHSIIGRCRSIFNHQRCPTLWLIYSPGVQM
jgi:hypothetical protein